MGSARTNRCGFRHERRCAIAPERADEAQALTIEEIREELPGTRYEFATVRNGVVTSTGRIEVPEEYYTAASGSAIECLIAARKRMLIGKPRIRAQHIVNLLIGDGAIARSDAQHAVAVIEVNLRKQIEEMYEEGRAELSGRFPLLLRTLIPLIRRSNGK